MNNKEIEYLKDENGNYIKCSNPMCDSSATHYEFSCFKTRKEPCCDNVKCVKTFKDVYVTTDKNGTIITIPLN